MYINSHISLNINSKVISAGEHDKPALGAYQFLLVQSGSVTITYPHSDVKYILQKNDVILLDPNTPFYSSSLGPNTMIGVRIDPLFIDSLIPFHHTLDCNSVAMPDLDYHNLNDILQRICSAFFSNADSSQMLALVYELAGELKQNFITENHSSLSDGELRSSERLSHIMDFLQSHYTQPLALNMLAEEMYLTPQYLSRFIKKHLDTNFTSLLTSIRLQHAYSELLHSADSITNIALNNGFPNIAAFNKVFRAKYKMSPNSYRQKYHAKEDSSNQDFQPAVHDDSASRMDINEIHIDSLDPAPYRTPWMDTINIGSLTCALKNSFHENFLEYIHKVPVKYVRFQDLFSEEVLPFDEESGEFSFANFDVIFNFFYANHVIPFIELSCKPSKGYVTPPSSEDSGSPCEEREHSYYLNALRRVLTHCLVYYGYHYLSQWRFEVWWKVDEALIPIETDLEYIRRYQSFRQLIKSMLPDCRIGGPGFNICGRFDDFSSFLTAMTKEHVAFDFLSLSAFSYELQSKYKNEELSTIGIISPDSDHIIHTFAAYHHYIRGGFYELTPVYITEFGSTLSLHNHIYESVFQAAFLCKNMLGLLQHCECIAYNYFIDSSTPFAATSLRNNVAYLGLISENGIAKPSLHAYHFLTRLGRHRIAQGANYIVTASSDTRYQLLCFHYTHFSRNFCFNSWENVRMENTYDIFDEEAPQQMRFFCNSIPSGKYKVTQLSLNRGYGSYLDKYLRILDKGNVSSKELLSTILNLREDELEYYKRTSIPRQDIFYASSNGTLILDYTLESHEIVFFELSKVL